MKLSQHYMSKAVEYAECAELLRTGGRLNDKWRDVLHLAQDNAATYARLSHEAAARYDNQATR